MSNGPIIVSPESSVQRLQRVELQATGIYDEKWLQQLIFANADLLPFYEIDADYTGAVPVCMELATKSGRVDCIYVTPSGRLVIAETKLYRNPQSRREVIGQILDYAKDLMNWSYDELDTKVCAINGGLSLFELVKADGHEVLEASFIDTVQRNLSNVVHSQLMGAERFGQALKEDRFLSSIRQRFNLPGGSCCFDLPALHYWLHLPIERKKHDAQQWQASLRPLSDALSLWLKLTRETGHFKAQIGRAGFFQSDADEANILRLHIPMDYFRGMHPPLRNLPPRPIQLASLYQ